MANYLANVRTVDDTEMELLTNDFEVAQKFIERYTGQEPEDIGTYYTVTSFDGVAKGTIYLDETF